MDWGLLTYSSFLMEAIHQANGATFKGHMIALGTLVPADIICSSVGPCAEELVGI